MNSYVFTPADILIFGQPSPFNSTEKIYRESDFVLNPIPFFGALRKKDKDIVISFISYTFNNHFLFPVPFDIVEIEKKHRLAKVTGTEKRYISDFTDEYTVTFPEGKVIPISSNYFVDSNWLDNYLMGENELLFDRSGRIMLFEPFKKEYRVGITINHESRTTEKGYLYFENFLRLDEKNRCGFYIECNVDIANKSITLGGESRVVYVVKKELDINTEFVNQDRIKGIIHKTGLFKLLLLTPTNDICEIPGAKLIAKRVGRPYVYAGWLRKDKFAFPSRLFRLIRPGAVFYYRIENSDSKGFVERLFERFWLKPSFFKPDFPYFEQKNGINPLCLGLTIIGAIKED